MFAIRVFIMSLAQCLYCKYFDFGEKTDEVDDDGNVLYDITAGAMREIYKSDKKLANIAHSVIKVRNMICHDVNSKKTRSAIKLLRTSNHLMDLLVYEGIVDTEHKVIELEGKEYDWYTVRSGIVRTCDDEDAKDRDDVEGSDGNRIVAASIMSGEENKEEIV